MADEGVWRHGRFKTLDEMVEKFNRLESTGMKVSADWETTPSGHVIVAYRLEEIGKPPEKKTKKGLVKKIKEKITGK